MTASNLQPDVNASLAGHPFIVVCSWCTSRSELIALGRQYPGMVSHSMCPDCTVRFEAAAGRS